MIASSAVFGWVAYDLTQEAALRAWENHHGPSRKLLNQSLIFSGLSPIRDTAVIHRALRGLPTMAESGHTLWKSNPPRCILILSDLAESDFPTLYCRGPYVAAAGWAPYPPGWRGFEQLLGEIEGIPLAKPVAVPHRDPREIRY